MISLNEFPLCIPMNPECSHYSGYLSINKRDYYIEVDFHKGGLANFSDDFRNLIVGYENKIKQRLKQCSSAIAMLRELQYITERIPYETLEFPVNAHYKKLIQEIDCVGWEKVSNISQDLSFMTCFLFDSKGRRHEITVHFDGSKGIHKCYADLPMQLDIRKIQGKSLADVLKIFQSDLEKYDAFWSVMEDFDKETFVMEPQHPKFCDIRRRIVLGNSTSSNNNSSSSTATHSSLILELDPLNPFGIPTEFTFFGSDLMTQPLKERLHRDLSSWNLNEFPRNNLERILQTKFLKNPSVNRKETTSSNEYRKKEGTNRNEEGLNNDPIGELNEECGICYSYELDNIFPDKICDTCSKHFHSGCLIEWLKVLPSTRQSFYTLFGQCPFCSESISVNLNNVK